jgi:hypothetical protein
MESYEEERDHREEGNAITFPQPPRACKTSLPVVKPRRSDEAFLLPHFEHRYGFETCRVFQIRNFCQQLGWKVVRLYKSHLETCNQDGRTSSSSGLLCPQEPSRSKVVVT